MPSPSETLVDLILEAWPQVTRPVTGPHRDRPLPAPVDLRRQMRSYPAWVWSRRHSLASRETLIADLAALTPETLEKLERLCLMSQALERMSDDEINWISRADRLPEPEQEVIYFFEVVGAHPGRFEGLDRDGLDLFVGDFGGFLGGDVTHWMPRPV